MSRSARKTPSEPYSPSTTTPCPSWNMDGGAEVVRTFTALSPSPTMNRRRGSSASHVTDPSRQLSSSTKTSSWVCPLFPTSVGESRTVAALIVPGSDLVIENVGLNPTRAAVIDVLQKYAAAVENIQDPVTGTWWQVLDKPTREENYLEASVSNMFVYTLLKGVREGYLDEAYLDVARRGYEGILDEFIEVTDEGLVNLNQTVSVGGLGGDDQRDGTFEYYMSEPIRVNDHKGVGPFIMASLLIEQLDGGSSGQVGGR